MKSVKREPKKELYLAIKEHKSAVEAFASAMYDADVKYIADHDGLLTTRMRVTYQRYIAACIRLRNLRG